MLFRARRATLEMMNFVAYFLKTCMRDRFNLESTFSCLLGESYIYEHDFLFFFRSKCKTHYEVGRYCEISCKIRARSQSALVIISLFDPIEKEMKRNEKKKLSDNFSSVVSLPYRSSVAASRSLAPLPHHITFSIKKESMYTHSQTSSPQSPIPLLYSVPYIPCKSLNSTQLNSLKRRKRSTKNRQARIPSTHLSQIARTRQATSAIDNQDGTLTTQGISAKTLRSILQTGNREPRALTSARATFDAIARVVVQ